MATSTVVLMDERGDMARQAFLDVSELEGRMVVEVDNTAQQINDGYFAEV